MTTEHIFNGYSLFDDIDDPILRNTNRSKTMMNIFKAHAKGSDLTENGFKLLHGYFGSVPIDERATVYAGFVGALYREGIEVENSQFGVTS
tara:strand:- start:7341 stop:7613 length:273 start_codon:yes stop_codon:yes gene_type:complete